MSTAGKNLKYLRKLRGWTQEEFATKLQIKRSLLGAYEEERAEPRIEVLESVGEIFKLTLDELLLKNWVKQREIISQNAVRRNWPQAPMKLLSCRLKQQPVTWRVIPTRNISMS